MQFSKYTKAWFGKSKLWTKWKSQNIDRIQKMVIPTFCKLFLSSLLKFMKKVPFPSTKKPKASEKKLRKPMRKFHNGKRVEVILAFHFFATCIMMKSEHSLCFFVRFNLISCRLFTHHFSRVQHFPKRIFHGEKLFNFQSSLVVMTNAINIWRSGGL